MKKNSNYIFKFGFMFLFTALLISACTPKEESVKKKKNDISLAKVFVKKEFVIESGFEERLKDFCKAGDAGVGNTWHHHQDGKTI